jgi:hypothetical protein
MTTLLMTSRPTADTQSLWRAAVGRGWDVVRVQGLKLPEYHGSPPFAVYTEEIFAASLAKMVGLSLIEPDVDCLARLPGEYTQRHVRIGVIGEARELTEPMFVKPPNDKSFPAAVYPSGLDLPSFLDDGDPVLIADPVEWEVEFRCFVLDRTILTLSPYLRNGILCESDGFAADSREVEQARAFAETVLDDMSVDMPDAIVLDVGRIAGRGWAVVELNAASSSGIYGCDPDAALTVIAASCRAISG